MSNYTCYDGNGNAMQALYQWDTDQQITVQFQTMPSPTPVFHFANRSNSLAFVVEPTDTGEDSITGPIPNFLLRQAETLLVYLYQGDNETTGKTLDVIHIPVIARPKPSDYAYSDERSEFVKIITGDSAYEIAVSHGYEGTEAQWLASLVGPRGFSGVNANIWYSAYAPITSQYGTEFPERYLTGAREESPKSGDVVFCGADDYAYFIDIVFRDTTLGEMAAILLPDRIYLRGEPGVINPNSAALVKSLEIDSYVQSSEPQYGAVKIETSDTSYSETAQINLTATADASVSARGVRITGVAEPSGDNDAVNKEYVDSLFEWRPIVWKSTYSASTTGGNTYIGKNLLQGPIGATPEAGHMLVTTNSGVYKCYLIVGFSGESDAIVNLKDMT